MSNLKKSLIRLGNQKPELRQHIVPVLTRISSDTSRGKTSAFMRKGDPYSVSPSKTDTSSMSREGSMVRIKKRTSLGELLSSYIGHISSELKDSVEGLDGMSFELRGEEDLGFRFTKHDEDGEKITFFADVSFSLAPEYINIDIKGARGSKNFSDKIRMFMTDPARKTVQRIASYLNRQ